MKKKRYTEAQIAFALRQAESGTTVGEIVRKLGIPRRRSTAGNRSSMVLAWRRSAGSSNWKKRTASSSSWWRTCRWTSRCCRMP